MDEVLELSDYRRRVVLLYLREPRTGRAGAEDFRRHRDELFRDHPQSALTAGQRASFRGLPYFAYDPEAVVRTRLEPPGSSERLEIDTGGEDGVLRYRRGGVLTVPGGELTLFWMDGYGGGAFLPLFGAPPGRAAEDPPGRADKGGRASLSGRDLGRCPCIAPPGLEPGTSRL